MEQRGIKSRKKRKKLQFRRKNDLSLAVIILMVLVLWMVSRLMAERAAGAEAAHGSWSFSGGSWYYEVNGERKRDQWVENDTYFVDDNGRMLTNEWVCQKKNQKDGKTYLHARVIPAEVFDLIDMSRLLYVGQDGRKVRNKRIYFTPFQFDDKGYCSLTSEDVVKFEDLDCGLDGLRRYVEFGEGYREYY